MNSPIKYLRKKRKLYNFLREIYGKTIGLYWLKKLYVKEFGFWNGKKRIKLIKDKEADKIISNKIKSRYPFMLARYGSTEFRNLTKEEDFDLLCFYSGFFPKDVKLLKEFRKLYFESSKKIDYLCVWNYKNHFMKKIRFIKNFPNIKNIFSLKATGHKNKWIKELKNKKVLVIHPFKATIEHQMKKRKKLGILPKFKKLEIMKAVQTLAGNPDSRFETWFNALDWMKKEIDKKDFEIALIGCGAYGLPLAAHVKSKGKQALHLAGGTQLLFGIKGKRWEDSKDIQFNKYWINPLEEDKMQNYKKIEGGCYW